MTAVRLDPIVLGPNFVTQPPPYVGGGGIARFRGAPPTDHPLPEDWVGSTVLRFGETEDGLTRLPGGGFLRDVLAADPVGFLGGEHVDAFGSSPAVLVKLLDAANRLTVHVHPTDDFARRHLSCDFGKTEAWIVLATEGDEGEVWVGFTRDVGEAELARWHETAAAEEMLANLHRIAVREGTAVLVPAGVPHAIGANVLVLELQQPTDFSIGVEPFVPTDGSPSCDDLGLGARTALRAVDRAEWTEDRLRELVGPGAFRPGRILPSSADPFFRADLVSGPEGSRTIEPGFSIVVGLRGQGTLSGGASDGVLSVTRGSTVLVPHAAGPMTLDGDVSAIVCRPGDPADR